MVTACKVQQNQAEPKYDGIPGGQIYSPGSYPMEISTQAGQAIYANLKNTISVKVPPIPKQNLVIIDNDGIEYQGTTISVAPTENSLSLNAYYQDADSNRTLLRSRVLPVLEAPEPKITAYDVQGNNLENGGRLVKTRPVIQFVAAANPGFASSFPEEANYKTSRAAVSRLTRNSGVPQDIGTFSLSNEGYLRLIQQLRNVIPGDQLLIELEGIVRINNEGEAISVTKHAMQTSFIFTLY
jgi:hypothetical protein